MKALLVCVAGIAITGCSTTATMFPIEGPVSKRTPLPIVIAKVDGILGNTGNFSFVSPDSAQCKGKWSSVSPQMATMGWGTLFTSYGTAAGFGSSVSNVPGVNKGQAFGVCADNVTFDVEFVTGSGTANGYGLAKDSSGNVYKLIF